jgi:drug/metabolite transporter (DMT)-like permease
MSQTSNDDEVTRTRRETRTNHGERGKWISILLALLGLWMILQALLLDLSTAQFWNDIAVGAILLAVGGYNFTRRTDEQLGSIGAALIAALVGLWLVAAPFVLGPDAGFMETANDIGVWNDIAVGLLALALGAYSAYVVNEKRERRSVAT